MIKCKHILFLLLSTISLNIKSQEELGYVNSNYAGVNSLFINPSGMVDSKIFIDVHLIGLEGFVHNNAAYIPKEQYSPLSAKVGNAVIDDNIGNKKAFAKLDVMGPAVAVSWDKFSFGLFTRFRTHVDAKMSKDLFTLAVKDFDYPDFIGKDFHAKAYASTISWAELGFNAGYMFEYSSFETVDAGINVKRLFGISSAGIDISNFDFTYNKKKDLAVVDMTGGYRISDAGWNVASGFGFDIGANYQMKLENITGYSPNTKKGGCKHIDYKIKLGASILDIGSMKFKRNAIFEQYQYKNQQFKFDSTSINSISDFDNSVNKNLTNNQITQTRQTSYRSWLPFALSLQADYNFENHFYINATTITAIKIPYQTKRVDIISITPRYERKFFEVAVPISLLDYRYPQMGIALRFGNNFIIGTNRISSITGRIRDVYGADIYFNFKMAFYRHCSGSKTKSHYKKKSGHHCAAYN